MDWTKIIAIGFSLPFVLYFALLAMDGARHPYRMMEDVERLKEWRRKRKQHSETKRKYKRINKK